MKIISHRGNLNGPNNFYENTFESIQKVLNYNFDVEIDVWYLNKKWFLGHDEALEQIDISFLENNKLWCHAKNLNALNLMLENKKIHCFWHQTDDFTITSKRFIWTYPQKDTCENSIIVLQNKNDKIPSKCFGICTDYPLLYI
jgi:glycerophosphoryl diester phosphodiesterase